MGKDKVLKFIDLFAGIGGFHYALSDMGFECVFASEKNQSARRQYRQNFPKTYINPDITRINPSYIPNHDILCGGFPCQPFSTNGLQKGLNDVRGDLIFYIFEILRIKKPKYFILENVKNLMNIDKGETFKMIIKELQNLDYDVKYQVVDAKNFTPQTRSRIFITGVYNDTNHYDCDNYPLTDGGVVGDIIRENPNYKPLGNSFYSYHTKINNEYVRNPKWGGGFGELIISINDKYPCVTRSHGYQCAVINHNNTYRYLDIIEMSRL